MFDVKVIKWCSSQRLRWQAYEKSEWKAEGDEVSNGALTVMFGSDFVVTLRKPGNAHNGE